MNEHFKSDILSNPWKHSASLYQSAKGVHEPHIAEISPMQYAHLSKTAKARYDTKRDQEWSASAAVKEEWRQAVIAAYDADNTLYDHPDLSTEARSIIFRTVKDRMTLTKKEQETQQRKAAVVHNPKERVKVGDTIVFLRARYTVQKVNAKSIIVEAFGKPYKIAAGAFSVEA